MARDPVRFEGGQANLWAYVGGDPVNLSDATGLATGGAWGACLACQLGAFLATSAGFAAAGGLTAGLGAGACWFLGISTPAARMLACQEPAEEVKDTLCGSGG